MKTISQKIRLSHHDDAKNRVYGADSGQFVCEFKASEMAAEFVSTHSAQFDIGQTSQITPENKLAINKRFTVEPAAKKCVRRESGGLTVAEFPTEELAAEFVWLHNREYDARQAAKAQSTEIPTDPHAQTKAEYAKLAEIYAEPWRLVQMYSSFRTCWESIDAPPIFYREQSYRIRPAQDITVNSITVPEPVRHLLKDGVEYWVVNPIAIAFCHRHIWGNCDGDWLKRGIIHLTQEAAAMHSKAMVAPSRIDGIRVVGGLL